ncbi:MAG: hypothetical protein SNH27_16555 [Rikenellaceae bacterium]
MIEIVIEIQFNDSVKAEMQKMPNGFAIICYNLSNKLLPDYRGLAYEVFFGDNAKANKIITEDQALELIEKYDLTLVVDGDDGKVWE